jgi:hypothetical protein
MTTREEWLNEAITLLAPLFKRAGHELPTVKVSVGWPAVGGTRNKGRRIGECWSTEAASDGVNYIFISPTMNEPIMENGQGILETLTHELCHAVDDCENGHTAVFKSIATSVGLEGKMTATTASEELMEEFERIQEKLGEYPGGKLDVGVRRKKQTTRMKKLECEECGYIARTTQKWLDVGVPTCPCGTEMTHDGG